jgi:hypothetical protein
VLLPKRHQMKHLEFVISWFGTRGSEVQRLTKPSFLSAGWFPIGLGRRATGPVTLTQQRELFLSVADLAPSSRFVPIRF